MLSATELEKLAQFDLIFHLLSEAEAQTFQVELAREVQLGHPLFKRDCVLLARREGRDDFLGYLRDGKGNESKWFGVHLTWTFARHGKSQSLPWPATFVYQSIDEYIVKNTVSGDGIDI